MKIDKNEFKSIVKECLVEILAEGLYPQEKSISDKKNDLKENIQKKSLNRAGVGRSNENQYNNIQKSTRTNSSYLDKVSFGNENKETSVNERTSNLVARVTKDPIMSEILADTAKSTLREQVENNGMSSINSTPADQAARIVSSADPADLFGASAGKWADLAFSPKINR